MNATENFEFWRGIILKTEFGDENRMWVATKVIQPDQPDLARSNFVFPTSTDKIASVTIFNNLNFRFSMLDSMHSGGRTPLGKYYDIGTYSFGKVRSIGPFY